MSAFEKPHWEAKELPSSYFNPPAWVDPKTKEATTSKWALAFRKGHKPMMFKREHPSKPWILSTDNPFQP